MSKQRRIFSTTSRNRLLNVHPAMVQLAYGVLSHTECSVVYGVRTPAEQQVLFDKGLSKTLDSKHLVQPDGWGHAIDLAPYVNGAIPWDKPHYFYHLAGVVSAVADTQGTIIRWGGDWDSDGDFDDQKFMDLVHFELVGVAPKVEALHV